jgi:hypothetical protein
VFFRKDRVAAAPKGRAFPVEWLWTSDTPPRGAVARILDGKAVAAEVRAEVAQGVEELRSRGGAARLDVILVGEDPASVTYVRNKQSDCAEVGMETLAHRFPEDAAQEEIEAVVERLNEDGAVSGFFIQLPLPKHLKAQPLLSRIRPDKDVDGLNPESAGRLGGYRRSCRAPRTASSGSCGATGYRWRERRRWCSAGLIWSASRWPNSSCAKTPR